MEQPVTTGPQAIASQRCAIEECPIAIRGGQLMCRGHWQLVPKPIQHDIYSCFRKRRGGPTHRAAVARAMQAVRGVLDGWAKNKPGHPGSDLPGYLPYRDD